MIDVNSMIRDFDIRTSTNVIGCTSARTLAFHNIHYD